jgi:hypothetical protein
VDYQSVLLNSEYIAHTVKVEVSGRSMHDPVQLVALQSQIDTILPQSTVAQPAFNVSVVVPERTFLEKVMLLHEEFVKPQTDIRTSRMSRHLYDIYCLKNAGVAERALHNEQLYRTIVEHRRKFINLRDFNYDMLYPATLSILPPASVADLWRKDYENMQKNMIYGNSPSYEQLLKSLTELQNEIKMLPYQP